MDRALTLPARNDPTAAPVAEPSRSVSLAVENMVCGSCLGRIERALLARPGVAAARASFAARRVSVTFDPGTTEPERLIEALASSGYRAA